MRKELLLTLALAACGQSDAADFPMIKQTGSAWTAPASEASPSGVIPSVDEVATPEGSSAVITSDTDDGTMWGAVDTEKLVRGERARELASKFPLPVTDDVALMMLIYKKNDASWTISYSTKQSVKAVGELYKKAYAAKGLAPGSRISIDEGKDEMLQLGGESADIHALATITRDGDVTGVMVQWEPKEKKRRRF